MTKLISVGDLLKNTWKIYQEKFVLIVELMAIPFLLMAVSQILTVMGGDLSSPITVIIGLVASIGVLWAGAGLIFVLRDRSRALTVKEAFGLGWGKLLGLVWVAVLTMFIVGGGFMLFIIPGIILTVWLLFSQVLVIAEDEKGMKAIVKSREYAKDYFWPILGRYLAMFVAIVIAYMVLMAIVGAITSSLGAFDANASTILFGLLGALINILITPMAVIYTYLVYENIKQVKGVITVDPAQKQGVLYLLIGLAGWALIFIISFFFMSMLATFLMGLFVSQALSGLNAKATADLSASTTPFVPTNIPAGLNAEQQEQLRVQMEALNKLQSQLKGKLPNGLIPPTE